MSPTISRQQKYNIIFAIGWLANFALFSLVVAVLVFAMDADKPPDGWVIVPFSIHILLFISFSASFVAFLLLKNYVTLVLTIVFIVGQFLCVLITSLTLISDDRVDEKIRFREDPIRWVKTKRWMPYTFSILFLPLFALQIFLINRHASHLGLGISGDSGRKTSPPPRGMFSEPGVSDRLQGRMNPEHV